MGCKLSYLSVHVSEAVLPVASYIYIYIYIYIYMYMYKCHINCVFVTVQSMMYVNDKLHYGLTIVLLCLQLTIYLDHHYTDSTVGLKHTKCLLGIFCRVCGQIHFWRNLWGCVFSADKFSFGDSANSCASSYYHHNQIGTVEPLYNTIVFHLNTHKRHPIARPYWVVFCEFKAWSISYTCRCCSILNICDNEPCYKEVLL